MGCDYHRSLRRMERWFRGWLVRSPTTWHKVLTIMSNSRQWAYIWDVPKGAMIINASDERDALAKVLEIIQAKMRFDSLSLAHDYFISHNHQLSEISTYEYTYVAKRATKDYLKSFLKLTSQ